MDPKLSLSYDREGDILHLSLCPPYPEQETEELGDEVVARLNPETSEIENLEFLFFSKRLAREKPIEIPVTGNLRLLKLEGPRKLPEPELWERVRELEGSVVFTLVDKSPNRIVKVTATEIVVEGRRSSLTRKAIYKAYEDLWEYGSLLGAHQGIGRWHHPRFPVRSVTPAILLKALPDQVRQVGPIATGGTKQKRPKLRPIPAIEIRKGDSL